MKLKGTMNHLEKYLIFFQTPKLNPTKLHKLKMNRKIFKQSHVERKIWRLHNQNLLCWSFYYISDNAKVDNQVPQLMRCHVCYLNLIIVANYRTNLRKGSISYFKTYERTTF